jgi:hypothetical protein
MDINLRHIYMMGQFCNILIIILNFVTLIVSISLLAFGLWIWNTKQAQTQCEIMFEKQIILLGILLFVGSLLGFIGACRQSFKILGFYLLILFLAYFLIFSINIFNTVVGFKGSETWLKEKVNNNNNWNTIQSCLQPQQFCADFHSQFSYDLFRKFYTEHFSPIQVRTFSINFYIEIMALFILHYVCSYVNFGSLVLQYHMDMV